ncbi:4'-phosphopantetheinyl transferase family protein [Hymenobacter sp. BRD67]|uniref:4'-phosphopantetheinyl transferase family protein n=1 Tax=Hymenobacter sp. BRD67 TaxID=2675877 RepID=UPI001565F240|nr:4'-phosphopantetheinyl transferase superfamily protein [Hymenobacter sp. BRD67]QKG51862.1 4'-phosphopantetheinyl transferase superfamily protein [Hymenobacter sp. BRD67]
MPPFLHVWQADLAAGYPAWPGAEAALSAAERQRQARLRTPALRQTYGRAHGFLRAVLGQYAGRPGRALVLAADANGKPVLPGSSLCFNLSYRPGRAVLAVASSGPVGVDVELQHPLPDAAPLIRELFAPTEQAALRATPPSGYWPLFHTIWTRKEAYAKALGMGLGMPFAAFSVLHFRPGEPVGLTAPAGASLYSFRAGPQHQGALATLTIDGPSPVYYDFLH